MLLSIVLTALKICSLKCSESDPSTFTLSWNSRNFSFTSLTISTNSSVTPFIGVSPSASLYTPFPILAFSTVLFLASSNTVPEIELFFFDIFTFNYGNFYL